MVYQAPRTAQGQTLDSNFGFWCPLERSIETMAHLLQGDKYAFLRQTAPPSYVAGLGRGASGFTTRSDIGPAREQEADPAADAAADGGVGKEIEADQFQDPENETGLFAGTCCPPNVFEYFD